MPINTLQVPYDVSLVEHTGKVRLTIKEQGYGRTQFCFDLSIESANELARNLLKAANVLEFKAHDEAN